MIKINLIAESQKGKSREKSAPRLEGTGALGQNVLMIGVEDGWYFASRHGRVTQIVAGALGRSNGAGAT